MTPDPARTYWRDVLLAGGSTTVPRWTGTPEPGVAEHREPLADSLRTAVRRRAGEFGVPPDSVLMAVHAAVLARLSGEPDVVTGYVADDGRVLPCRLDAGPGTWRALVDRTHRAVSELRTHADAPIEDLRRELGVPGPVSETVLDPTGTGDMGDAVLHVAAGECGSRVDLRVRYRTDALDARAAARIAGYHRRALELMVADPDADSSRQSLLSAQELRFQLVDLAGPHRDLPDRRFHELVEDRAAATPDAVAVVLGDRRCTYRELNARANRLARALLARGLEREDVVAVVTERDLDWMAAVLAVAKAGGAYLPIEPHFPADRIATTLTRAGCRLVLTEEGSTAALDAALATLPGVRSVRVDAACAEGSDDSDPGIPVAADQLAYVYFTSGSTGQPKGAMCEHAGLLNHLFAKIDDLGIGEGQVVAQTAPQCFDISLWQLVSALLVGGRTLIVPQDVVLDVGRFVDTLVEGRVSVLQVVPSYLEVVLAHLEEHPRPLPDLRCVSVTGEAVKGELARRWFATVPGIALVNAYGLTETSDDTNHEVMHRAPAGDRVPLGRPVGNVQVRVVDEQLSLVPLGAPGEIVFAGVCVGRGYVNDPERTAQAFPPDPLRPGQRIYRSGDHGRWRPDGKLEFLGRRDNQVKIAGFRIEIGEIENALLRAPGVRDGAVVVTGTGQTRRLVAFCTGPQPLEAADVREHLARSLPAYMVPAAVHWRASLPLTANGKTDRRALTALAAELAAVEASAAAGSAAPRGPAEQRLAAAWAQVLGVPVDQIGRQDSFFDLGGTSLSAVKLAVTLDRSVSHTDVVRLPVLADLAALLSTP
ncbi:non-ribosomal peptide synthetase [Geodermatophilus sp. CPCC 206100]|uniref:non-ribosomal peptide synthetase n=1 Tax=Geodermatophilus sp. CPCC 206100 TaxID=3020054 RepID=UPI003B009A20